VFGSRYNFRGYDLILADLFLHSWRLAIALLYAGDETNMVIFSSTVVQIKN
jgi:hypothetical protein